MKILIAMNNRDFFKFEITEENYKTFKTDEIKGHIKNFRDYSIDNTEEYKKEIDKLIEEIKC